MRKCRIIFAIYLMLILGVNLPAQTRGELEVSAPNGDVVSTGKNWAVFIAIDKYVNKEVWEPLDYPVIDAKEIRDILFKYYEFNSTEIRELYDKDATAAAIEKLFSDLKDETGPNDSVFIFHAGHGIDRKDKKIAAWIPYDGGAQTNWVLHSRIRVMLDSLKARHVFLISDSCYSGILLDHKRGRSQTISYPPAAYAKKSRQVMSSGADETVDDISEFAARLKDILEKTETTYMTADYLWYHIKYDEYTQPLRTQPILAVIPGSSHEIGGNFLFYRRNPKFPPPPPPPPEPDKEVSKFFGIWKATIKYNNFFDSYWINLIDERHCTVTVINDNAEQETTGFWSWDEKDNTFRLEATFRNAKIPYLRNISWLYRVSFANNNNSFRILGKPATNAQSNVLFEFFRD